MQASEAAQRVQVQYADEICIREGNTAFYRLAHWPIWITVFYLAADPLTFQLFARGPDRRMAVWLALVCAATGIAGLRGRLPGVEPQPYIIRFTEDRPNPLYRRLCYTAAWSDLLSYAALNVVGVADALARGRWHLTQIYHYGWIPVALAVWLLGLAGKLPRTKPSTLGEGAERRIFYGAIWAVTWSQVLLLTLWLGLGRSRAATALKLFGFALCLGSLGYVAWRGRLPRTKKILMRTGSSAD